MTKQRPNSAQHSLPTNRRKFFGEAAEFAVNEIGACVMMTLSMTKASININILSSSAKPHDLQGLYAPSFDHHPLPVAWSWGQRRRSAACKGRQRRPATQGVPKSLDCTIACVDQSMRVDPLIVVDNVPAWKAFRVHVTPQLCSNSP